MEMLPAYLRAAAAGARDRVSGAASQTASALGRDPTRAMAATAGAAIFADALLAAVRARLEALRSAARTGS